MFNNGRLTTILNLEVEENWVKVYFDSSITFLTHENIESPTLLLFILCKIMQIAAFETQNGCFSPWASTCDKHRGIEVSLAGPNKYNFLGH